MRNEDPGLCLRPWNSQGLGLCSWRTAQRSPMPGPQSRPVATPSPMVSTQSRLLLPPDSKLDTLPAAPNFLHPASWPPGCSLLPQGNDLLHSQDHRITHKSPSSGCHRNCQKHTSFPPVGRGPDLTLSHFPLTHMGAHTFTHRYTHPDIQIRTGALTNTETLTHTQIHTWVTLFCSQLHGVMAVLSTSHGFQAPFTGKWSLRRWPGAVRQTVLR